MKKNYFFLFLLFPFFSFSQNVEAIFLDGNFWQVKYYVYDFVDGTISESIESIFVSGDTMINEQDYKIISSDAGYIYGYGYDADNKTYLRLPNDTSDILLYDFNLSPGDSFALHVPAELQHSTVANIPVINVFSINNGNLLEKEIIFDFNPPFGLPYETCQAGNGAEPWLWISGIGSNVHPLYPALSCLEIEMELLCFAQNGEEKYGSCSSVSIKELQDSKIKISPNPFGHEVSLNIEKEKISAINLYNLTGQLVAQSTSNQLQDLSHLPQGIYTLLIQLKSQDAYVQKLIKH